MMIWILFIFGLIETGEENGTEYKIYKFGWSDNIRDRVKRHKKTYGSFTLLYVLSSKYRIRTEKIIKGSEFKYKKYRIKDRKYDGKIRTELIKIDSTFTEKNVYKRD